MKTNRLFHLIALAMVLISLVAACTPQATPAAETPDAVIKVEEPVATEAPVMATEDPAEAPAGDTEVVTVLEAIAEPVENLPTLIQGNPPEDFGNFGSLYAPQVMEDVKNYRTKGAVMEYTCPSNGYVFISMDPGKFMDTEVKNGGIVLYECAKDELLKFSTPHYSQGDPTKAHQQVTVSFVTSPFPKFEGNTNWGPRDALILYKDNEGKAEAFYFPADGELEVIK